MKIGWCPRCKFQNFLTEYSCRKCHSPLQAPPKESKSLFSKVRDAVTKRALKKQQIGELKIILGSAIDDGVITDQELEILHAFYESSELSRADFSIICDEIFMQFVDRLRRDHRISPEEKNAIVTIAERIGFSQASLNELNTTFRYFELLYAIENSSVEELPVAGSSRVILREGEYDYFTANGSLMEERVIKRELVGRSHGISIPTPLKGVRYRVGASRGKMVSERGIVPVSYGEFTITNKRMVFSGDKKSVNAEFSKLQDFELFSDAIRFSLINRQTPVTVLFDDKRCVEVVGLYVNRLLKS